MDSAILGMIGFVVMLLLSCSGLPMFLCMFVVSIAGFWMIGGPTFMLAQLTNAPYQLASSYLFAVVPMFVLMGYLAGESGLSETVYYALTKWVGKIRGGQLMATIGANAIIGAISAVPIAATSMCVKVALPELLKLKYDRQLCLTAIATAGTLVVLIPPSTAILVFCILTDVSIGKALVAGIIPGILLTIVFCMTIWIYGRIHPDKVPVTDIKIPWREKFSSLTSIWPIGLFFIIIIGGIYLGVFPPTVGGAVGSVGVLIYALVRRVEKRKIGDCFWETVMMNGQLFPMIIGGFIFARFVAISGVSGYLTNYITSLQVPPLAVMAVILVLYILISFPMELMPIMIITLPVFFPLLTSIGFSPYVLVIVLILIGTLGMLTPPIGMGVFVVATMAKVDAMEIFRGAIPWFITVFVFIWVLIIFPPITTWLPNLFYR